MILYFLNIYSDLAQTILDTYTDPAPNLHIAILHLDGDLIYAIYNKKTRIVTESAILKKIRYNKLYPFSSIARRSRFSPSVPKAKRDKMTKLISVEDDNGSSDALQLINQYIFKI